MTDDLPAPRYASLEEALMGQGFVVAPPPVAVPEDHGPADDDDPDELPIEDADAPVLEEALAERTYVRDPDPAAGAGPAGPPAGLTPPPDPAAHTPVVPSTLPDRRPPTPPPDLRERLRALAVRDA